LRWNDDQTTHASPRIARRHGVNPMTKQVQDAYIVAATRTPVGKATM
jgi:acetyl-CoA acyltransferase